MNPSYVMALIIFGCCVLFALLIWVVSNKHPQIVSDPSARRRAQWTALLLLIGGAGMSYYAFVTDNQMRITTLHEEMVPGSVGASPGASLPKRMVRFVVEHPGVEHELFVSPDAQLFHSPDADAEITISLIGPKGKAILPESTERFAFHTATTRERGDWEGKTYPFTPIDAGTYTLRLQPKSPGIPRIHVYITDPLKRDGKRIPGY